MEDYVEQSKNKVAAYIKKGEELDAKSMHLAVETETGWKELNFGIGVLFAEANFDGKKVAGTTRLMEHVYIYRREDKKIGVIADCSTAEGRKEEIPTVWMTENLVDYQILSVIEAETEYGNKGEVEKIVVAGELVEASILSLSEKEADYLQKKLGEIYQVSVEPVEVHVPMGEKLTNLSYLKAHYSDGSTAEIPVIWNKAQLSAIPYDKEGVYFVEGEAVVKNYETPILQGVADPMVRFYQGMYYLVGTNEWTEGRDIYIRKASTIEELQTVEKHLIFKATEKGEHSGCNWAPELHVIGEKLCCLFASSLDGKWNHVQSRIMYCEGNPIEEKSWSEPVRICKADGNYLIEDGITLDMTYFEAAGKSYYCWAQRKIDKNGIDTSDLMIAEVDPKTPERLAGEPVLLCRPKYAWNRQHTEVVEGPHVLKHAGKLYMSFSGDSVSDYYCLGMLVAEENAKLTEPSAWTQIGYPVLGREHVTAERGPGHNAFTKDEYGRDVIVYHAKPDGGMRSFYARTIHYAFDGTPIFYMTSEQYLKPEFRKITAKVIVEKPAYLFVHFREKTTPDGEQVYFGLSKDGLHWEAVYDGQPLLWAYYGDKGVRDFTITRCENNGKFYIFATDLSLSYGMRNQYHHSWAEIGRNGSHCLSMWESEDLVNWSEQKLIPLGGDEFGCRWAPDILHDVEHGDYILHWSSPHACDNYQQKAIYYSRTKDFKEFTKPALLYRKEDSGVIDSAMYEENGKYYLFVKSEKNPCGVILLESDHATGPFQKVDGLEASMHLENPWAYEAPTAVRLTDGKWCLFLDYFGVKGKGQGYVPFMADTMENGAFVRSDSSFSFPYGFKHGTILKITYSEYERIRAFDWSEPEDGR